MGWEWLGAAAGSVVGSIGDFFSNQEQQKDQRDMSREQMAFQERMSSSAYQRATADMRNAGLNPMLAYMQGGASSPPGASYDPQSMFKGVAERATASAMDYKRLMSEMNLNKESAGKIRQEKFLANALERKANAEAAASEYENVSRKQRSQFEEKHPGFGMYDAIMRRMNPLSPFLR